MFALIVAKVVGALTPALDPCGASVHHAVYADVAIDISFEPLTVRFATAKLPTPSRTPPLAARAYEGKNRAGQAVHLTLARGSWLLRLDGTTWALTLPPKTLQGIPRILGVVGDTVWVAAAQHIIAVDTATADVTARYVRSGEAYTLSHRDDHLWLVAGRHLLACGQDLPCEHRGHFDFEVERTFPTDTTTWVLSVAPERHIYLWEGVQRPPQRVLEGAARPICQSATGTWFEMDADPPGWAHVVLEQDVMQGREGPQVAGWWTLLGHAYESAADWPVLAPLPTVLQAVRQQRQAFAGRLLWRAVHAEAPAVRAAAAQALDRPTGVGEMALAWMLSQDREGTVREEVFKQARAVCPELPPRMCTGWMELFVGDPLLDIAWTARDILLGFHPRRALEDASTDYKLEVLPALVHQAEQGRSRAREALEMLRSDADPVVRREARQRVDLTMPP